MKIATGGRLWYNFEEPAKAAGMGTGPGPYTPQNGRFNNERERFSR